MEKNTSKSEELDDEWVWEANDDSLFLRLVGYDIEKDEKEKKEMED